MEKLVIGQEMNVMELEEIAGGYIRPLFPIKPGKPTRGGKHKPKFRWKSAWDKLREMLVL